MNSKTIRQKFLDFFAARGHVIVPSSSLIPDDPSVLLTTAGMQQFKPYLTGKADPVRDFGGRNVFSIQKCFRTDDIDEVGDFSHLTFFEMAGNFSFGGYFKETAIPLSFEFLTSAEGMAIPPEKIFVTAFKGDETVPRDDEAIARWQEQFKKVGMSANIGERIFLYSRNKNWWEVGSGSGPAGPDAEMFYDLGAPHDPKFGSTCHPNCDCGRFVEIGNDVFVQYNKTEQGIYEPLTQKSIDNGRGFERLVMVAQGKKSVFETDIFTPLFALMDTLPLWSQRIVADHARATAFLIADGILPSNKDRGYILRRLIRRALAHMREFQTLKRFEDGSLIPPRHGFRDVVQKVIEQYPELFAESCEKIIQVLKDEQDRTSRTYENGKKMLADMIRTAKENGSFRLSGRDIFNLVATHGFSLEWIKDIGKIQAIQLDMDGYEEAFKKHQEISRAGAETKFGGHGLYLKTGEVTIRDESEVEKVTRLHTATHLLHASLRAVLGPEVRQNGSDITAERTRFDFTFERKMTPDEMKRVEEVVNEAIRRDFKVDYKEMPYEEAMKSGALHFFREKYPQVVRVYTVHDLTSGEIFSREFCGGPHVEHTGQIGHFSIIKEEASSAGVRRIRAIVE